MASSSFVFLRLSGIFFPNVYDPWLVESAVVESSEKMVNGSGSKMQKSFVRLLVLPSVWIAFETQCPPFSLWVAGCPCVVLSMLFLLIVCFVLVHFTLGLPQLGKNRDAAERD